MLVAHQFVCAGGILPDTCESESLSVGGTDGVDASLFDGFDYEALGHLHKAQRIGRDTVRYAGSPLKYSLSETDHRKKLSPGDLGRKGGGGHPADSGEAPGGSSAASAASSPGCWRRDGRIRRGGRTTSGRC